MANPVFTKQQDGSYLRQEIVQEAELDPEIAGWQRAMDEGEVAIQDYVARIAIAQDQIASAKQKRDAIIAAKATVNP